MIKLFYQRKVLFYSLTIYLLGQSFVWYSQAEFQPILLIVQQVSFFIAIVYSIRMIFSQTLIDRGKQFKNLISIFLTVNLLLLLHWVVTVYFDPEINWKLQGNNYEVDPWYYILYLPAVNFLIALLTLTGAFLVQKLRGNRNSF
jgi:hypothetical protein